MATFKELTSNDVTTSKSFINQLIDIIQEDVSGSSTRRKYQVFVTGGVGPGVTSSLFQTVYDQDFTLSTANPIFDVTVGLYVSGACVTGSQNGEDSSGKLLFPSTSLMMREKVDIYEQFAKALLGDADSYFTAPANNTTIGNGLKNKGFEHNQINEALFINVKRLFARDQIKRETFAMRFYQSASRAPYTGYSLLNNDFGPNLKETTESGSVIFTDAGSASAKVLETGGNVSNIVDSSDTSRAVGIMFNDQGIAVLDLGKVMSGSQHVSGVIDAMSDTALGASAKGETIIGQSNMGNDRAKFIPDFMVSASIDNIVDHICSTRFSSGTLTAATFQNVTNINSTIFFCRATADEFNYSSNPSYVDADNRIRVIDLGQEDTQRSFAFVSSVGLYDANDNLLAVAKLSRPVEKNDEKDITFRVRLDF